MEKNHALTMGLCDTVYSIHIGRFHWLKGTDWSNSASSYILVICGRRNSESQKYNACRSIEESSRHQT